MNVIVNSSPFIALDRIGKLDILFHLFGEIIRPQAVVDELQAGRHLHGGTDALFNATWIKTRDNPPEMALRKELGDGETAVIAIALRMKADLVVLDDLSARNVAVELGLPVTGTLGLLLAAHRKGLIETLDECLDALRTSGFHISDTVYNTIITMTEK